MIDWDAIDLLVTMQNKVIHDIRTRLYDLNDVIAITLLQRAIWHISGASEPYYWIERGES